MKNDRLPVKEDQIVIKTPKIFKKIKQAGNWLWRGALKSWTYKGNLLLLLLGVGIYKKQESLLQKIDSNAVGASADYLSNFAFAYLGVILASTVAMFIMLVAWKALDRSLEKDFQTLYESLSPIQKIGVSLGVYFFLFFGFIILTFVP
mgnify:CR=1 FL=1